MSILNGYCTLAQMNYQLGFTTGADTVRDAWLEDQVEAVSRAIDDEVGHRFYAATETRYFTPQSLTTCRVSDLLSVSYLYTDPDGDLDYDYTWTTSDYLLMPANAVLDGWPYSWIERHPNGSYYLPVWTDTATGMGIVNGVKLTGSFGFCTLTNVPMRIQEACRLVVAQLFMRKSAIYGVAGPEGLMFTVRQVMWKDQTVLGLLQSYKNIL